MSFATTSDPVALPPVAPVIHPYLVKKCPSMIQLVGNRTADMTPRRAITPMLIGCVMERAVPLKTT